MTEWLGGLPKNNECPPLKLNMKMKTMDEKERFVKKIQEEFVKFERTMEELHFLKLVSQDLKSFREMIKLKKYD